MNHFSIKLWHVMKSGFYTTTGNDQLSGWTEKKLQSTSQSQTCTQKRLRSLIGGLLSVWSTTALWIPAKPTHLRSMFIKSMRCTKSCNTCSWHWSTERAQFSLTTPDCTSHNQRFKSWTDGLWSFASSTIFTWPLINQLPLLHHLDNFLQGKCFQSQQKAGNAFQEFIKSLSIDFDTTRINKLISCWQKCVDYNGSYFK